MKNKTLFLLATQIIFIVIVVMFIFANNSIGNNNKESNVIGNKQNSSLVDACKLFTKEELLSGIGIEFRDELERKYDKSEVGFDGFASECEYKEFSNDDSKSRKLTLAIVRHAIINRAIEDFSLAKVEEGESVGLKKQGPIYKSLNGIGDEAILLNLIEFEDKYIQFIWRIENFIYAIALSGINPSDKQIFENRIQNLLKEKF